MQAGECGPAGDRAPGGRLLPWLSVLLVLTALLVVAVGRPAALPAEDRAGSETDRSEPDRSDDRPAGRSIGPAEAPDRDSDPTNSTIDTGSEMAPARWCAEPAPSGQASGRDPAATAPAEGPHEAVSRGSPPTSAQSRALVRSTAHRSQAVRVHTVSTSVPCRPVPLPTCSPDSPLSEVNAIASREGARTAQGSTDIPVSTLANSPPLPVTGLGGVSYGGVGPLTWWYAEVPTAPG